MLKAEDIYEDEYLRLKKAIPADWDTYGQDVIDELAKNDHDEGAQLILAEFLEEWVDMNQALQLAYAGDLAEAAKDAIDLAIDAVAHWRAVRKVHGFWPQWQP